MWNPISKICHNLAIYSRIETDRNRETDRQRDIEGQIQTDRKTDGQDG